MHRTGTHRTGTPRLGTARLGALMVVLVLGVSVFTACSDSDSESSSGSKTGSKGSVNVVRVYSENDTHITVALEHPFAIALPVTAGTGYEWTAVTNPKLQQMTTEQVPGGSQPGAQGTQRITFRSQGTGTTTLVLNYARSFEPDEPPAKTATFDVTITD